MRIKGTESAPAVLKEIGLRIKQHRISMEMTQAELAERCGVSASTEVRIENGEDSKFSNYIKILTALNMLENIDLFVPEPQPSFKALFEEKPPRKRVRTKTIKPNPNWVWGEDK